MSGPYKPIPTGNDWIAAKLADMQAQIDALRTAGNINNAVVSSNGGSVRSADFDGDPLANDFGTNGWYIGGGAGSGSLAVFNTIDLRSGIIGNDALANPVTVVISAENTTTAWATTTTLANKVTATLAIPAGFDRAIMFCFGGVVFTDSAPNRFDARCTIDGDVGSTLINLANLTGCTTVFHQLVETGVSGSTITIATQVRSAVATAGAASNQATVAGFAICLRS